MQIELTDEERDFIVSALKFVIHSTDTSTDAGSTQVRKALDLSDKVRVPTPDPKE